MSLRVLHVIPSFAGGGAERQLVLLSSALSRVSISVHIGFMHEGPNFAGAANCGAVLHRLRVRGNHDPNVLPRLMSLIHEIRPDVVQTWLLHADVFGGLAATMARVPWLLSERASAEMYRVGIKFRLRRIIGRTADAIVANSSTGLEYWREAGFRGTTAVIRNIVPPRHCANAVPVERTGSGDLKLILAVGRLHDQKNWPMTLRALEIVLQARPDATAVVLGDGELRTALQDQIAASSWLAGRVRLLGFVDDVDDWFRRADVFVSLSKYEGTPNTVIEAMSHRCPVVVSDISEHREIVGSETGWLVPRDDPRAVAKALMDALTNREVAAMRAARAGDQIAAWSPAAIASEYTEVYRRLVGGI